MAIPRRKSPAPEIPLTSTADVAFLLLIFFLVAASNTVDKGRPLDLPSTTKTQDKKESKSLEIGLTTKEEKNDAGEVTGKLTTITLGGEATEADKIRDLIFAKLKDVHEPALRVVQVTADAHVEYQTWIRVLDDIEAAGGIVAPQLEEEERKSEEGDAKGSSGGAPAGDGSGGTAAPSGGGGGA